MTNIRRTAVVLATMVAAGSTAGVRAQLPQLQSITAASGPALAQWTARVDSMLRDGSLDIATIQTDTMLPGRTHERLGQRYRGLPVFGGEIVRQVDGGTVRSVFGRLFDDVAVASVDALIDPAAAAAAAERAAGPGAVAGEPELGILPGRVGYVLAYRMKVRSAWDVQTYDVNARTGAIEHHVSRIMHQSAIGAGTGVLRDPKKVSAIQGGGGFQAIDRLRPAIGVSLDFHGSVSRLNSFFQSGRFFPSDVASSSNNNWTDGPVVDAHVYQGWVYDYYFKRFGRHSLDDHDIQITGLVHPLARSDVGRYDEDTVDQFINNAAYIGDGFMYYGDGDGRVFDYLSGALDVVGHELTHGVTDFSSQLDYQDEPGALNEAFSDIMGTAIEFFYQRAGQGPQKGPNFVIAEDVFRLAPGYLRSLQAPASVGDPDHYSLRRFIGTVEDNGGVHFNSTIASHAFYLAVNGGRNRVSGITVTGVGLANIERMERIFYRAFVFLMGPLSQFRDARAATLQAAADLYGGGSNERAQVEQAWTAVGVQ